MKFDMVDMVQKYLKDRELAWAPSTLKSESARLGAVAERLTGDAAQLWTDLKGQGLAPYTLATTWTRVVDFWNWLLAEGHVTGVNPYHEFRCKHGRLFKYAYEPKKPQITFEEASARIATITDEAIKGKALQLLTGGLRWSESFTLRDNRVIGKGSKPRRVYCADDSGNAYDRSYSTFLRALAKVGLKPHDLRKLCATRLAAEGLGEADLMAAMGWNDISTASAYLAPRREDAMARVFERLKTAAAAPPTGSVNQGGTTDDDDKGNPAA